MPCKEEEAEGQQVAAIFQEQEHILCLGVDSPPGRARVGMELCDRLGLSCGIPQFQPYRLQEAVPHGCRSGRKRHQGAVLRQVTDDIPPAPVIQEGGR